MCKERILISYLSLSRLFKSHSKSASVGAGDSNRSSRHTNCTVVVFLLVHESPGLPAVHSVVLLILAVPFIALHSTVPEAHSRIRAGGNNQVGSEAHRVDRGGTQMA